MTRPDYHKWYKTKRWQRVRKLVLDQYPMCQCPHCKGKTLEANVVDHIKAHKGDQRLFWDRKNLMAMNSSCHNSRKQSQEMGGVGFDKGCDASGRPLNEDHPWYQ